MQFRDLRRFNLLLCAFAMLPASSALGSTRVNPVATIDNGVIIAHGNELSPPFTVAAENDTLCFYDGAGRRFARANAPVESASSIPRPRLVGPPSAGNTTPEIAAAQIAHLLSTGGLVAFGRGYLWVFPSSAASEVLADVRWVALHAAELTTVLPPGDPLLQDLLNPMPLGPPPTMPDDAMLRVDDPGHVAVR